MLIRHSAVYVAAKLVPGLVGMASTALLTRLLTPASYGEYGLALVVMTFGSAAGFDWLGLAYLRLGGAHADETRAAATTLAMFAGLVALTAVAAAAAWAAGCFNGPAAAAIGAGLMLMWCYAGFELAARFHVARSQPAHYLLMNLGRAVLSAAAATATAWWTHNPVAAALALAAGTLGGIALGGWPCRAGSPDWRLARAMLAFGLPLAASLALAAVATSGARSLIEVLASAEQLGWYTAGFLVVQNTLAVVAAGIASAGYSLVVRAVERGDTRSGPSDNSRANGSLAAGGAVPHGGRHGTHRARSGRPAGGRRLCSGGGRAHALARGGRLFRQRARPLSRSRLPARQAPGAAARRHRHGPPWFRSG